MEDNILISVTYKGENLSTSVTENQVKELNYIGICAVSKAAEMLFLELKHKVDAK